MNNEGAECEQRTNRCCTAEGINTYRINSRTENDVTYLNDVLKMNFAKPKFRNLLHIREIRENFLPQKFPTIRYMHVLQYKLSDCTQPLYT